MRKFKFTYPRKQELENTIRQLKNESRLYQVLYRIKVTPLSICACVLF
jgi:hypothetical protein